MQHTTDDRQTTRGVAWSAIGSAACATLMAALALLGIGRASMGSAAAILASFALVFEGARTAGLLHDGRPRPARAPTAALSGIGVEVVGGVVGTALGILGLFGLAPFLAMSMASAVVGGSLIVGGARPARADAGGEVRAMRTTRLLCGVAAVSLGVLGLLGVATRVLPIVGIVVGSVGVLSSGAMPWAVETHARNTSSPRSG